jgi:hypothetical protein
MTNFGSGAPFDVLDDPDAAWSLRCTIATLGTVLTPRRAETFGAAWCAAVKVRSQKSQLEDQSVSDAAGGRRGVWRTP